MSIPTPRLSPTHQFELDDKFRLANCFSFSSRLLCLRHKPQQFEGNLSVRGSKGFALKECRPEISPTRWFQKVCFFIEELWKFENRCLWELHVFKSLTPQDFNAQVHIDMILRAQPTPTITILSNWLFVNHDSLHQDYAEQARITN